jgi:hypothetical protein
MRGSDSSLLHLPMPNMVSRKVLKYMKKLIAIWGPSQDISVEQPRSIRWEDGMQATLNDYMEYYNGTRVLCEDHPHQIKLIMFPDVIGDVVYDVFAGSWVVKDAGFGGWSLDHRPSS